MSAITLDIMIICRGSVSYRSGRRYLRSGYGNILRFGQQKGGTQTHGPPSILLKVHTYTSFPLGYNPSIFFSCKSYYFNSKLTLKERAEKRSLFSASKNKIHTESKTKNHKHTTQNRNFESQFKCSTETVFN